MPRVTITGRDVVLWNNQSDGISIERVAGNTGYLPYPQSNVVELTTSTTASNAGVHTVSGSASALIITLPSASNSTGMMLTFRSLSAHAHVITASNETPGTTPIHNFAVGQKGSKATIPATVGMSLAFVCDGLNWMVMGGTSGSVVLGT